jgi:predicted transposase YdaD
MTIPNRNYKDSLFVDYFRDKERLIEAYNALSGADYPPTADVEYATLDNVLHRSLNNDIAFVIEGKLVVLIEHQSTINANMPLRLLMYLSEIYKRLVPQKTLYQKGLKKIPVPEFIVVYNGERNYPDKSILRLSDAYLMPPNTDGLELTVPVYNIARGRNKELLKRSAALSDYAMFVSLVQERVKAGDSRENAIEKTIYYCLERSIMGAYLERQSAEVKNMLITEWNDDEYREAIREEAIEEGRIDTARKMKTKGFSIAEIVEITELSEEDIVAL